MIQLVFHLIFLILLFSIMGKIIYDYFKGRKLKYASYGLTLICTPFTGQPVKGVFS